MKQKGCAASRAEQKPRFPEHLDARVCETHFCSAHRKLIKTAFYGQWLSPVACGGVFCVPKNGDV